MRPSPIIPSSIIPPLLRILDIHAARYQIPPQLRCVLKVNCAHVQLLRALQIQFPVINEQTFVGTALSHFESQFIDALIGLSDSQIAGTKESLELTPQVELMNPA